MSSGTLDLLVLSTFLSYKFRCGGICIWHVNCLNSFLDLISRIACSSIKVIDNSCIQLARSSISNLALGFPASHEIHAFSQPNQIRRQSITASRWKRFLPRKILSTGFNERRKRNKIWSGNCTVAKAIFKICYRYVRQHMACLQHFIP